MDDGLISFQVGQSLFAVEAPQRLVHGYQSFQEHFIFFLEFLLGALLAHDDADELSAVPRGFDGQFGALSDEPVVLLAEGCIVGLAEDVGHGLGGVLDF